MLIKDNELAQTALRIFKKQPDEAMLNAVLAVAEETRLQHVGIKTEIGRLDDKLQAIAQLLQDFAEYQRR